MTNADATLPARSRQSFYRRYEAIILGGTAVVIVLTIWEGFWSAGRYGPLASAARLISPLFMSGPSAIATQFRDTWVRGTLRSDIVYSGTNFAVGFALLITIGNVSMPLLITTGWVKP